MRSAYREYNEKGPNCSMFFYDDKLQLMSSPPWTHSSIKPYFLKYDQVRQAKKASQKLQPKQELKPKTTKNNFGPKKAWR